MKESGGLEGKLTCPTSVQEAGSHPGLLIYLPPEILQTASPRAVFIQDNVINIGGWKQEARGVRLGKGFGSSGARPGPRAGRHLAEAAPPSPPALSYSTPCFSSRAQEWVQLLGGIHQSSISVTI